MTLYSKSTALVLVDLQQGIVGGELAPHSASDVVPNSARLADAFRQKEATVVLVQVDLADFSRIKNADRLMQDPNDPPPPPLASELVARSAQSPVTWW